MPYPFDPAQARHLLQEAGYANGLPITLIASEDLAIQATVVSKMLEHVGFTVALQVLDAVTYNQKTVLSSLDQPPEPQAWDIALASHNGNVGLPVLQIYHQYALDDWNDWVIEQPELRRLQEQVLGTVDRERQQELIRQMERHTHDQTYFLFLYNPIRLYAVNKAVEFVPYVNTIINLDETGVTAEHWSVRKQKTAEQE